MALTQFNQWEPQLDPVNGVMAQEPRVFSHDAVAIVQGAVNTSAADSGVSGLISGGTGYAVGSGVATTGGAGTGLTVNILTVDTGVITSFEVAAVGSGYAVGNTITISTGGANATFTVTDIDIPNTQKRGCCIYVGAAAGLATLNVTMESGNNVSFNTISAGTILPILIKRINTPGLAANDVIALY